MQVLRVLTVQDIKDMQCRVKEQGSQGLAPYLRTWWQDHISSTGQVDTQRFLSRLVSWFERSGFAHKLKMYDEDLKAEGVVKKVGDFAGNFTGLWFACVHTCMQSRRLLLPSTSAGPGNNSNRRAAAARILGVRATASA